MSVCNIVVSVISWKRKMHQRVTHLRSFQIQFANLISELFAQFQELALQQKLAQFVPEVQQTSRKTEPQMNPISSDFCNKLFLHLPVPAPLLAQFSATQQILENPKNSISSKGNGFIKSL